jgi:hypothetical protein
MSLLYGWWLLVKGTPDLVCCRDNGLHKPPYHVHARLPKWFAAAAARFAAVPAPCACPQPQS